MNESQKVFTLIELLAVMVIIAILATMLLPVLNKTRDRAKVSTCQGNLKQVAATMLMYADDNADWGPSGTYRFSGNCFGHDQLIDYFLRPRGSSYTTNKNAIKQLICPGLGGTFRIGVGTNGAWAGAWNASRIFSAYRLAFGTGDGNLNTYVYGWVGYTGTNRQQPIPGLHFLNRSIPKIGTVSNWKYGSASETAMLGDCANPTGVSGGSVGGYLANSPAPAHPNGANTAFMDGHVQWTPTGKMRRYIYFYQDAGGAYEIWWD